MIENKSFDNNEWSSKKRNSNKFQKTNLSAKNEAGTA